MNLGEVKTLVDQQLGQVISSPEQLLAERSMLLEHCLGITREQLYTYPEQEVDTERVEKHLRPVLEKRVTQRVPLQHLIGEAVFYGMTFQVSPDVLIPRPETELLVEEALSLARQTEAKRILDLGTGSGCIAITLKKHYPQAEITTIDNSPEALSVAQKNASHLGASIRFLQGSWFAPVACETFDLIVSNPPYIAVKDKDTLTPEVLYEPHTALFSPDTPESLYRQLIADVRLHLSPNGSFLFEMGHKQSHALEAFAKEMGFKTKVIQDYAGIDRILTGTWDAS
jgi:release factor glutamine methyltransferase